MTSSHQREKNLLEALLFVAYEPMPAKKLADIMGVDLSLVKELILELVQEYQCKGFQLKGIAGGWQFLTNEDFAPYIEKLYNPRNQQLSKAALETLAIIAYRQPITRLEIENIRQVKVDAVVNKLLDKSLVKEVGRREGPGRPILYGTTKEFLSFFGIVSLKDLPPLASFEQNFEDLSSEKPLFSQPQEQTEAVEAADSAIPESNLEKKAEIS